MTDQPEPIDLDLIITDSVVLNRIIEEVRNEPKPGEPVCYNRTYHRHNRS